jgi:hypothetical protein
MRSLIKLKGGIMAIVLASKIDAISMRFKNNFRERFPEWITSLCILFWGLLMLTQTQGQWDLGYFSVLENLATQKAWGTAAVIIGILRVIALGINGGWRPTAHMRAIGAIMGIVLWSAIIMSYLTLPYTPLAIASKSAMLSLDMAALWYAAGDAKVADVKAHALNSSSPTVV